MKKLGIYMMSLLALGFAACDDKSDLGIQQVNPQGPVFNAEDVTITPQAPLTGDALNLADYEGKNIPVLQVGAIEGLSEEAIVSFVMQLSATEDFAQPSDFELTKDQNGVYSVSGDAWDANFRSMFGRENDPQATYVRCYGFIEDGNNTFRIGGPSNYYVSKKINVTPVAIEAMPFDHAWLPGGANGWDFSKAAELYSADRINFEGFAALQDGFKIVGYQNWDNGDFGYGGEEGKLATPGDNIPAPATLGMYFFKCNLIELTYSMTPITSVSMIGGFNDSAGDVELTPSADLLTWTGTLTLATDAEWKFRMNNGWDFNLGGDLNNLELNGGNINSAAGTYEVTLSLVYPYSATVVAK